ncbi:MAG: sulfatase-like hydrolase/transferase, partial [Acidimicrobiales bacterium]
MAARPNVLMILTDQERYPPAYEGDEVTRFRRERLGARERLRAHSIEMHSHYTASTACQPSRTSLFTGQYPSLHGVTQTNGLAKLANDPAATYLDPDTVPTMGDWFRAAGYRTFYRGKWHISHADLPARGHAGLKTSDAAGVVFDDAVDAYLRADRLDPFGFSGWIGREPHGADPADSGYARDEIFATQVSDLFGRLGDGGDDDPWLAIASLVNPHDIVFAGMAWEALGMATPDDSVPGGPPAPSQDDSLDDRPGCHRAWRDVWTKMLWEQQPDASHRSFYLWLHEVVDRAIDRILDSLAASPFADNTIVVFSSDHGEMLGAHGGLLQKWHNAYDETIRVPLVISGPGIEPGQIDIATSHVDLLPTLLGLVGADVRAAADVVARTHVETAALP